MNGKAYECTQNKQNIQDKSNFNGALKCPDNINQFCDTFMTCDQWCQGEFLCINGKCISDSNCLSNQYYKKTGCVNCDISCETCQSSIACKTCATDYYITLSGLCIKCSEN